MTVFLPNDDHDTAALLIHDGPAALAPLPRGESMPLPAPTCDDCDPLPGGSCWPCGRAGGRA